MATYPPSTPKPNEVVRRSQSFCLAFPPHKKSSVQVGLCFAELNHFPFIKIESSFNLC